MKLKPQLLPESVYVIGEKFKTDFAENFHIHPWQPLQLGVSFFSILYVVNQMKRLCASID